LLRQFKLNTPLEPTSSNLRSIAVMDEACDEALLAWAEHHFGFAINQLFGNSEMPALIGDSHQKWAGRNGTVGKIYPGHRVAVLQEDGTLAPPGETGELAVNRLDQHGHIDPAVPLRRWRLDSEEHMPDAQGWWRTGELARLDLDGFVWHEGHLSRRRIP
jgi:acetyl-CoA synthetase